MLQADRGRREGLRLPLASDCSEPVKVEALYDCELMDVVY